jgi:hypothetical protein
LCCRYARERENSFGFSLPDSTILFRSYFLPTCRLSLEVVFKMSANEKPRNKLEKYSVIVAGIHTMA